MEGLQFKATSISHEEDKKQSEMTGQQFGLEGILDLDEEEKRRSITTGSTPQASKEQPQLKKTRDSDEEEKKPSDIPKSTPQATIWKFWSQFWPEQTIDLDEEERKQSNSALPDRRDATSSDITGLDNPEAEPMIPRGAVFWNKEARKQIMAMEEEANSVAAEQMKDTTSARPASKFHFVEVRKTEVVDKDIIDLNEEEKQQAKEGTESTPSSIRKQLGTVATQDDNQAGLQQVNELYEACRRILSTSTSTSTVSTTIHRTWTRWTTIYLEPTIVAPTTTTTIAAAPATVTTIITTVAAASIQRIPSDVLQTAAVTLEIPLNSVHPDLGPGVYGYVTTLTLPAAVTTTNFHRTMSLVVPTILPPLLIGLFMEQIMAMQYGLVSDRFILLAIMSASVVCAVTLFLETFGFFAFVRDVWGSSKAWWRGEGWSFDWGWKKDNNDNHSYGRRSNGMAWTTEYTERTERRLGRREGRYVPTL
ncbi:hypothetical protein ACEQ8H_008396 [Pleosporales sp. CAS-2024a]